MAHYKISARDAPAAMQVLADMLVHLPNLGLKLNSLALVSGSYVVDVDGEIDDGNRDHFGHQVEGSRLERAV